MLRTSLKIENSLSGECKLLLASGHYRTIHHITSKDYLINRDGKPVKVKEVRFAGKKPLMNINSEAWHEPIIVSEDQKIITDSNEHIIIPSTKVIQWRRNYKTEPCESSHKDKPPYEYISFTYEYGFVLGLLLLSGMISDKNIVLLIKNDTLIESVKLLNRCLSSIILIRDIEIIEGKCILKYMIEKNSVPKNILDMMINKTINEDIFNPCKKDYIKGLKNGISFALKNSERLDKLYTMDHINLLCDWVNLVYSNDDNNRHIKFYLDSIFIRDRVWDIILENKHETFIMNNILCISQDIQ